MQNETFLNNIDIEKLNTCIKSTNENGKLIYDKVQQISDSYTNHLDKVMKECTTKIIREIDTMQTDDIESYYLKLESNLYFLSGQLEEIGIKSDMSKAARQEVYNKAYMEHNIQSEGKIKAATVAENQAIAEEKAKYETVVNDIYSRVYKIVKQKIDSGYEMCKTLHKVYTRRLQNEQSEQYINKTMRKDIMED